MASITASVRHLRVAAHSDETFGVLNSMRLSGELCDVELLASGRRMPAHRLVLASCSPYFRAMFTTKLMESRQREVEIKGVDPDALESLVEFSYTSRITVSEENTHSLLAASTLLQFTSVRDACAGFLQNHLRPSNCLGIRCFADLHSCTDLMECSHRFALLHFGEVSQTEEFLLLPLSDVLRLVSSDEVYNVQNEEVVYNAAVSWVKRDPDNRKQALPEILLHVRLPSLLTKEFVMKHVENDELVRIAPGCEDLLVEGMKDDILSKQSQSKKPVLFAIGGENHSDCECYDPTADIWKMIAPMSRCRSEAGVAVLNNKIYAIGGRESCQGEPLATVEAYSPESNSWSVLPPMDTPRSNLGVAVLDGFLYAIGGYDGISLLSSVERYDPLSMQWTPVASMGSQR